MDRRLAVSNRSANLMESQAQRSDNPNCRVIRQVRCQKGYDIGNGIITVHTKHRWLTTQPSDSRDISCPDKVNESEDFVAKITFSPHKSASGRMFTVTTSQGVRWNGSFSPIPRLDVNRVLPDDSLVFRLVREGRLRALQNLLREGKASLKDHDELGNSLIIVSVGVCPPPPCIVLMQNLSML